MDTGVLWTLVGSFTNVFILTRLLQYLLKRLNLEDRRRAYIVFCVVGILDLIGLLIAFKEKSVLSGLYYWLFFYLPFLIMWLLKDLMEASRKKKEREAAELSE